MTTAAMTAATRAVQHRGGAGDETDGDAGEGDVAHPVADERQPPLDEEDADHRRDGADEQRGDERPLHEVDGEQVDHGRLPSVRLASSGPASEAVVLELEVVVVAVVVVVDAVARGGIRLGGPVEADAAAVDDDDAGQQPLERVRSRG